MEADGKILRDLGINIRNIRKQVGFTQQRLSEHSKICSKFLSELENGRRNVSYCVLCRIASALGKNVSELLNADPEPSEKVVYLERIFTLVKDKDATTICDIAEGLELILNGREKEKARKKR